jgi:histidine ammonia-lyase
MVTLTGSSLTLDELVAVARTNAPVQLDAAVAERMKRSRAVVERALASEAPV